MQKKWDKINELIGYIAEDDTLDSIPKHIKLKCLCYAPNIGYRSWIFRYEGVLIALFDAGNGHYGFHTAITYIDLLVAKLIEFRDTIPRNKHSFL